MKPARILVLSPWIPWPPYDGARIRILNTLRYLCERHDVTLVAPLRHPRDAEAVAELRHMCEDVVVAELAGDRQGMALRALEGALRGRPLVQSIHYGRALADQVRRLTAEREFDIVQVEFSWFTPYLGAIDPQCRARTVLTLHNVESLRFARELGATTTLGRRLVLTWDHRLHRAWESRAVNGVDAVVAVSEAERRWVEQVAPDALVVVAPNGVDIDHYQPSPIPAHGCLAFTGAMDYPPNIDGVLWFHREVWPALRRRHPALRLEVIGRDPDPRVRVLNGEPGIRITGQVADVRLLVAQATAVVVPLRAGAGTRLKIPEAMAMGRPVISTTLGAEGLDVTHGADILLADTALEFIDAVDSVLRSPDLARRLGEAGRQLAVKRYDWRQCLAALDALYERLLDPATAPARRRAS